MLEFIGFVGEIVYFYMWILGASVVLSWLIAFNVVNTRNRFVAVVAEFLFRATEPVLRPIRRVVPNFGGIDISPLILWFILLFILQVLLPNIAQHLA
jgi:YggT family protein